MIDIQNMLRGRGQLNLFDGNSAPPEHDYASDGLGACRRCGCIEEQVEDGIATKTCPGNNYYSKLGAAVVARAFGDTFVTDRPLTIGESLPPSEIRGFSANIFIVDDVWIPTPAEFRRLYLQDWKEV